MDGVCSCVRARHFTGSVTYGLESLGKRKGASYRAESDDTRAMVADEKALGMNSLH